MIRWDLKYTKEDFSLESAKILGWLRWNAFCQWEEQSFGEGRGRVLFLSVCAYVCACSCVCACMRISSQNSYTGTKILREEDLWEVLAQEGSTYSHVTSLVREASEFSDPVHLFRLFMHWLSCLLPWENTFTRRPLETENTKSAGLTTWPQAS